MSSEEGQIADVEFESSNSLIATFKALRHSPTSLIGLIVITLLITMAVFAMVDNFLFDRAIITWLHADPHAMDQSMRYAEPSRQHPFGSDRYGRDILSRVIYGSRTALTIGILAVGIGFSGGVIIGVVSAYFGGYVDDVLMRSVEVLYSIPGLLLAMIFMAIFGPNIYNLFIAYGIVGIPGYARLMRSEALSLRDREYVEAAKLAGLPRWKILFREIVPNGIAPVVVQATLSMGSVIIGAAALSFLGFGVQPPTPDWGRMLSDGRTAIAFAWWVAFFPGIMIFLTVMGFNMLGDGLRDIMDPKMTMEDVDETSWDLDEILAESAVDDLSNITFSTGDAPRAANGGTNMTPDRRGSP